ncbi:MAG: pyridoxamine 5'-phosphate oxidase family protein [Actinobacteria bacterium]|nr:pyridoxamine 5'-phosphate oxidase family protein [Actinomycetota bacterium]
MAPPPPTTAPTTAPASDRVRVRRLPDRGAYDRAGVHAVLDAGFLCHLGFAVDGQPYVIPTLYGRDGDVVYVHGSAASRMLRQLAGGVAACLTVTHVDGLVLARSAFHHSINYRSAVVLGSATLVDDPDEKLRALEVVTDQVVPGRWAEVRGPSAKEDRATAVLRLPLDECSVKIRDAGVGDDVEDLELDVWAGVVPLATVPGAPVPDPGLRAGIPVPASVAALLDPDARR